VDEPFPQIFAESVPGRVCIASVFGRQIIPRRDAVSAKAFHQGKAKRDCDLYDVGKKLWNFGKKKSDQAMYRRMTMRRSNIVAEALILWAEDCLEELEEKK
jgi:hypothetical protein